MDAFHAQKCSARKTPAPADNRTSVEEARRHCFHSPVQSRNPATMTSEKKSRHAAIASGSDEDSFTRGPAKEIPSSEKLRTRAGESARAFLSAEFVRTANLVRQAAYATGCGPLVLDFCEIA